MKIAVRLDDITPDMDWDKFLAFKEILDRYGIKPLIGVVPDNRDENLHKDDNRKDFWKYVKELQALGWVVAMHGFEHVYTTDKGGMFPLNHFSEYAGLDYEKQLQMILDGKRILKEHGMDTDIFMAPAHSYDRNTVKALLAGGFHKMTDGFGRRPYVYRGMTFYPISFLLSSSLRKKQGYTTMVVHTNEITKEAMLQYKKMFAEHEKSFISYGDYLKVRPVKRGYLGRVFESFLAKAKHVLVKLKK